MIAALLIAAASPIEVGRFQAEGTPPAPWQVVRIDRKVPPTRYRVTRVAGVTAVEATAVNSMALLLMTTLAPHRRRPARRCPS